MLVAVAPAPAPALPPPAVAGDGLAPAGSQYGSIGQYGELWRGGGFDATAYDGGRYDKPLTAGKFIDPVGFAVDAHDTTPGGDGTALYVLDRTSNQPALVSGGSTSWRLQKLDDTGHVLGIDEFSLPADSHYYGMLGLAVDPSQGRIYALVVASNPTVDYVDEILAWSTTPSAGQHLVAPSGFTTDTLSTGVNGYLSPGLLSTAPRLSSGGAAMITDPQGLTLDGHSGSGHLAVQGGTQSGHSTIEQVATASGASQGEITGQWSSSRLAGLPNNYADQDATPAGISTAPDGSLTIVLNSATGPPSDFDVVDVPANLTDTPVILSSTANTSASLDDSAVAAYDANPEFPDLDGASYPTSLASPQIVALSNGLYATEFEPDPAPNSVGSPQPDPQNPAGGPGLWTHLNPAIRLLAPEAGGVLSDPGDPMMSLFDTLGNPDTNTTDTTKPASACNLSDAVTAATAAAQGGPVPSLAGGANGSLWILTRGSDSSPDDDFPGPDRTGGRELIELAPEAGDPCPGPSGTFAMSAGSGPPVPASSGLSIAAGTSVTFDAATIDYQGAATAAYAWTVVAPDGSSTTTTSLQGADSPYVWPATTTSESFDTPGLYTVVLQVFGDFGEYDVQSGAITVGGGAQPTASFAVTTAAPQAEAPVAFDASGSTAAAGSAIFDYHWKFGDGEIDDTTTPSDAHVYSGAGTYTVTLTVIDADYGQSPPVTQTVLVAPAPPAPPSAPTASFTFSPPAPRTGQPVNFNASASAAAAGVSLVDYHWSWGDGTIDDTASADAVHTYTLAGSHTVQLTVRDSNTLVSAVASQSVTVSAASVPKPPPPRLKVKINAITSAAGRVSTRVSCPAVQTSCAGSVQLKSATAATPTRRKDKRRRKPRPATLTLGRASFRIAGGKTKTVSVRLSARARALLRVSPRLRVIARFTASNPQGESSTLTETLTLRRARLAFRHVAARSRHTHRGTPRRDESE